MVRCTDVLSCVSTGDYDRVLERRGNGLRDDIALKGGNDLVLANKYTRDRDEVRWGTGRDKINVADGDTANGRDYCIVDSRSEVGASCASRPAKTGLHDAFWSAL